MSRKSAWRLCLCISALATVEPALSAAASEPFLPEAASMEAAPSMEFDSAFLVGNAKGSDMSRFQQGNPVPPGTHDLDIHINGRQAGRERVRFIAVDASPVAQACFSASDLRALGIDPPVPSVGDACRTVQAWLGEARSYADLPQRRLYLRVPQASLRRTPRGYVGPAYWDPGITAAKLDYNLSYFSSQRDRTGSNNAAYMGLRTGVNIGLWQFRHNGSFGWSTGSRARWNSLASYVQRPLAGSRSLFSAGEISTRGDGFDGLNVRGASLASDERMYPDSQIGFAPTVRSFARSNARVEVWQNGVQLYQTTVTPGNFVIDDLYPTGYGGNLNVVITEADGSERRFDVPYAAVANLLRPGRSRYEFVAGQLHAPYLGSRPWMAQGTWYRGMSNALTGYGGIQFSQGFRAVLAGMAFNTSAGAFSVDLIAERADAGATYGRSSGQSVKLAYSKQLEAAKTSFTLAAYRYSTDAYLTLPQFAELKQMVRTMRHGEADVQYGNEKDRLDFSIDQPLGRHGSVFLTGSTRRSWQAGTSHQFEAGFNGSLGPMSYSLSASRTRDARLAAGTEYFLGLNVPLGSRARAPTLGSQYTMRQGQGSRVRAYLSGTADDAGRLSYGVAAATASDSAGSGSANLQYRASRSTLRGSYEQGGDYRSFSFGSDGTVVAHRGGLTFAPSTGDTVALVSAPGGAGARIGGLSGLVLDRAGYGVVPYLSAYRLNTVTVDPKGSSLDVTYQSTAQQVAPYAGAVVQVEFATRTGKSAVIHIANADTLDLPFGADVLDGAGNVVGIVGQGHNVFAQGIGENGTLTVGLQGGGTCQITYQLAGADHPAMPQVAASCLPDPRAGLSIR